MALSSFKFFADSGLTTPITSLAASLDIAATPVDKTIYLGSTDTGMTLQATSSPGTDPIVVSISDSNPTGGEPATAVILATTSGGLDTGTPGAALNLPATINSGVANAQPIWLRITDATGVPGTYSDLSLTTNDLTEA